MEVAKRKALVSVVMITYNHENYIKEAVEGVLMQNCDFDIELIIADDKSSDETEMIVDEIIKTNPNGHWIKYTKHVQNKGMMPNFMWAIAQAKGKYIALCEGDDYWVNSLKLQKQVDFLEEFPDYNFSMGIVDLFIEKTGELLKRKEHIDPSKNETYILKDYLKAPFSQTSSFLFRNEGNPFPDWFENVNAGDQSLVVVTTGVKGKIKYHNELFSVYRVNESSVSFKIDREQAKEKEIFFLNNVNDFTQFRFNKVIVKRKIINQLVYHSRSENQIVKYLGIVFYLIFRKI